MNTLRRILCPVDLSPESAEALRYAVALARACGAKLFVCYCADDSSPAAGRATPADEIVRGLFASLVAGGAGADAGAGGAEDEAAGAEASGAEASGAEAAGGEAAPFDWECLVVEGRGDPAAAITREAAVRGVDLIVMRSRRRPRAAALLGSTAEAVCRTAPCPVLVTHAREREWVSDSYDINLRRVLVAYDFSTDSELALRHGLSLAEGYGAELHLLHVLAHAETDEPELAWAPAGSGGAYEHAARRLDRALPAEAHPPGGRVVRAVRRGKPYREVLAYAAEAEIDLVCMGAHGAGFGMSALFGSNVDRVLRQAPCPVLVARPLKPATAAHGAHASAAAD